MNQLDLPARAPDPNVGALSVDAKWVADKLSEYGFKMVDLETLYPAAETIATEWAARGDELISIDLVTGEMRRRFHLRFSNTVRPFLARMLRDRRPGLRPKIDVTTTSRGRNSNIKVAIDHLDVVAVIHRTRRRAVNSASSSPTSPRSSSASRPPRSAPNARDAVPARRARAIVRERTGRFTEALKPGPAGGRPGTN